MGIKRWIFQTVIKTRLRRRLQTQTPIINQRLTTKKDNTEDNNHGLFSLVAEKKFICRKCDKQFSSPGGLHGHNKSVHEGVRHACDHCDYKATRKSGLKVHIESIHEGLRHPCNFCEYKATTKASLH